MRWLEEYEMKHMEFRRCIKSFDKMYSAWESIAAECDNPGYRSFAKRQANVYLRLRDETKTRFAAVGYSRFVECDDLEFVSEVYRFREKEIGWLKTMAKCT